MVNNLNIALGLSLGEPAKWGYLIGEIELADENLLLAILNYENDLILDETSPMPHRMSPESMLKLMAVRILIRTTGKKHLDLIDQVHAKAQPPLACGIEGIKNK